jgi:hypothetical protein
MPNDLLGTGGLISNAARKHYEDANCPDETDLLSQAFVMHQGTGQFDEGKYLGTNPLGDPVIFSSYLIGQIANNSKFVSSFNLDADRGYGYLCWDWTRTSSNPEVKPTFGQDDHGNVYQRPTVQPEGADNWPWPRPDPVPVGRNPYPLTRPLELHYPGRICPKTPPGDGNDVPR